jgi:hypothetical protein
VIVGGGASAIVINARQRESLVADLKRSRGRGQHEGAC